MTSSELVETVAKAIHVARFKTPGARPVEPMGPADHEYCNRLASAALTAIQPLLSATHYADCQPIETAPKDGHFLGWNADDEIWEVWAAATFHRAKGAWPKLKSTGDGDPHQLILGVQASAVTHWMPLPGTPPTSEDV